MAEDWCTIESDPGVFTELISNFGVSNVQVDEIYSLDQSVEQSYGLIFLFKWQQEAMLSILLNSVGVDMGQALSEFKEFTMTFDDEMKGIAISNSDMIRDAHNSFARSEPFQIEELKSSTEGEAHHFIAYVPFKGKVYELDGLKTGPIKLGEADSSTWLEVARPAIEARMARYSASETHFALLSLNPKRSAVLQSNISVLEERLAHLEHVKVTQEGFGVVLNDGFEVGTDGSSVDAQISATNEELRVAREDLSEEELKLAKQREENVRRKHNYLPFLIRLVESLAGKGKLAELVSTAQSTATTRATEKAHVNEE